MTLYLFILAKPNVIFMKPNSFYGNAIHSAKSSLCSRKRLAQLPIESNDV